MSCLYQTLTCAVNLGNRISRHTLWCCRKCRSPRNAVWVKCLVRVSITGRSLGGDAAGGQVVRGSAAHLTLTGERLWKLQHNQTAAILPGSGEGQWGVKGLSLGLPPFQSNVVSFQLGMNQSCFIFQTLSSQRKSQYIKKRHKWAGK